MLTLIWVILLLADKGSGTPECPKSNSSITLSERNVSAQAGLCVVLACSFTTDNGDVENITWYKHDGNVNKTIFDSSNNTKADSEFQGRVSLLEPNQKNKNCSIIINDLTESDSGSYQVVVKTKPPCTLISDANVTVTVTLSEKPTLEIPEITEGELTTLTCSAPGLCPGSTPNITWIWSGSGQSVYEIKENNTDFKSTLTFNASAKHNGGQVTCKVTCNVTFKSVTTNETKTLNVKYAPRILNDSNCVAQSKVLTCVCISEGFPSPTIKWPHLESHTEYCVTTNVSNTRVTSTITVSHDHCHNSTIECVSSNSIRNTSSNVSLIIKECNVNSSSSEEKTNNIFKQFLMIIQELKVIIAVLTGFVIGIILSTVIACLVTKSRRKKWKRSENPSENLEMVTSEAGPTMDADQAATYDGIREPEDAEGEAESVAQLPSNGNCRTEVEYSDINFSALRPKNPEEAENTQDATDTEYAEIKREELRQEDAQEDSEMLEGNEENELMSKKDNEEGEDVALYSSVEELMG
ncbi:hypothetical protein ACER0C_016432 [Sarotherodon galilaeus]